MKMKRILAIVLSFLLVFGLLPAAFAAGVMAGDVSGDGEITAEDARLCLRQAVGLEQYEKGSREYLACDVTKDGEVTAEDARLILRAAVGLEALHTHEFGAWEPEKDDTGALTGKHFRTCECGEKETEDCAYGELTAVSENKEPTCTEPAIFEKVCSVCGGKATETKEALGHSFGEWKPEKDGKGALTGKHIRECACGATETEDCAYGEWVAVSENKEPTCTKPAVSEKSCSVCGGKVTDTKEALGHQFGDEKLSPDQYQTCARCGEKFPYFNTLVNVLKNGAHTYTGFSESINSGKVTKHKFYISLAAKAAAKLAGETLDEETIIKQFTDEMTNAELEYGNYAYQRPINNDNFYRVGLPTVCDLREEDIQSITVEEKEGIDFLASLPDVVKIKSLYSSASFDFDLSEKIKKANIGSVLKVTVTLKDEKYADIKDPASETAMMRGMDQDLRLLVQELNQSEDIDGMKYEMKCEKATSKGKIIYYLDAVTMLPIAAIYDVNIDTTENFTLDMKLAGVRMMDGSMTIEMNNKSCNYYFFDSYFG